MFNCLNIDTYDEVDHNKIQRKARKKLKEIHIVKQKSNISNDEQTKIDTEDYWNRILNPGYINKSKIVDNIETENQRKKREKKIHTRLIEKEKRREKDNKIRKREEIRQQEERRQYEEKRKQEERAERRQYEEKRQQEEREERRQYEEKRQERRDERRKSNNIMKYSLLTIDEKRIRIEMNILLEKGHSNAKARHKLLLKYHPDKNPSKHATKYTQIINNTINT